MSVSLCVCWCRLESVLSYLFCLRERTGTSHIFHQRSSNLLDVNCGTMDGGELWTIISLGSVRWPGFQGTLKGWMGAHLAKPERSLPQIECGKEEMVSRTFDWYGILWIWSGKGWRKRTGKLIRDSPDFTAFDDMTQPWPWFKHVHWKGQTLAD